MSRINILFLCILLSLSTKRLLGQDTKPINNERLFGKIKAINQKSRELTSQGNTRIEFKYRSTTEYDTNGLAQKRIQYNMLNELASSTFYKYQNGLLTEIEQKNNSGASIKKTFLKYNATRLPISSTYFERNEQAYPKITYLYDATKKLIVEHYNQPNGESVHIDTIFYDIENRDSVRKSINADGYSSCYRSFYNKNGWIATLDRMNNNGQLDARTSYVYKKTDKNGNWLKREIYRNDKRVSTATRTISYYKE